MEEILNKISIDYYLKSNYKNDNCILCENIKDKSECGECQIKRGEINVSITVDKIKRKYKKRKLRIKRINNCFCKLSRRNCRNLSCIRKFCYNCNTLNSYCNLHLSKCRKK